MFKITARKGFQMTFENGWTVSVQFGGGNYCANRGGPIPSVKDEECSTAEIAAWDADGNWHDFGDDMVDGWKTADEVAKFISRIQRYGGKPRK